MVEVKIAIQTARQVSGHQKVPSHCLTATTRDHLMPWDPSGAWGCGVPEMFQTNAMLHNLFLVPLSVCYLCAKQHLDDMNPAIPTLLLTFQTMNRWRYIVIRVLFNEKHVRSHATKLA